MQLAREIPVLTCSLTPSPPSLRSRFLLHYEIMKFLSGFFYIILFIQLCLQDQPIFIALEIL